MHSYLWNGTVKGQNRTGYKRMATALLLEFTSTRIATVGHFDLIANIGNILECIRQKTMVVPGRPAKLIPNLENKSMDDNKFN